jgi:hypothetical protein
MLSQAPSGKVSTFRGKKKSPGKASDRGILKAGNSETLKPGLSYPFRFFKTSNALFS